jgi:hypothetical protein
MVFWHRFLPWLCFGGGGVAIVASLVAGDPRPFWWYAWCMLFSIFAFPISIPFIWLHELRRNETKIGIRDYSAVGLVLVLLICLYGSLYYFVSCGM